ncbi:CDP-glycerol glycerophosphotransferase family protein [Jonesiaceae bacterium BS-20]|uniref:CDP-glycerol glycerophosphotransferase family protein n=1 Tax=Jonesiaceae bacterium BS-20 TaxID=3120821 RepID=A0AAU7DYF9_9MICO
MTIEALPIITGYGQSYADNAGQKKPVISVIVPMYRVAEYLADLFASIDAQIPGDFDLEFIFVDDGSPDNCAELAHTWLKSKSKNGIVIEKANGGVSSARNAGLEVARGSWVAFPDPDDLLSENFFESIARQIATEDYNSVNVIAANLQRYFENGGEIKDNHPLNFKFKSGNDLVDLTLEPHYIQLSAATAVFRKSHIDRHSIRFDTELRASEDAVFLLEVLSRSDKALLGINADSVYYYRKREAGTSALDTLSQSSTSYVERLEQGYLRVFNQIRRTSGQIPNWMMSTILYEFRWLFGAENSIQNKETVLGVEGRARFLEVVTQLLSHVSKDAILGYRTTWMSWEIRILLLALKGEENPDRQVYVTDRNHENNSFRLAYWYTGELPDERFVVAGRRVTPIAAKIQTLDYFGQRLLKLRVVWLPGAGDTMVFLDGSPWPVSLKAPHITQYSATEKDFKKKFQSSEPLEITEGQRRYTKRRGLKWHLHRAYAEWYAAKFADKVVSKLSIEELYGATGGKLAQIRRVAWEKSSVAKYGNAWVFMDRLGQAQDNAEHLYRWVRVNSPETNIWFVLEKDSPDWPRLAQEGFNLVEFRGLEHYKLMMNAINLISSHLDYDSVEPIPRCFYINSVRPWKFTFLQHGITKDDLSLWFNEKKIDLFITSTVPEFESLVADNTNYSLTSNEVKNTGMPRFDALQRKARSAQKDILLVAPTWRNYLLESKAGLRAERSLIEGFRETDYFRNWNSVLSDPLLVDFAEKQGLDLVFLPHPALMEIIGEIELPEKIRVASYADGDIQDLFVRTKFAITDYSSIGFDLVYAGSRLVYFQFDREVIHGKGHTMREGYFSYDRDGFGPVALDPESVFEKLTSIAGEMSELYESRTDALQWHQDERACERVYEAVVSLHAVSD